MDGKEIVTKAWKESNGGVIHEMTFPNSKSQTVKYATVIGGISWPDNSSPGYACILGQLWDGKVRRFGENGEKGTLKFLGEYHSDSLSIEDFFRKITDGATMFHCVSFYADLGDHWQGYRDAYKLYIDEKGITDPSPSLNEAPYADNLMFGIQIIRDWKREGKIFIPEDTIVHEQLTSISREDLKDPEANFWAVNALRYVVGAFQKHDFRPVSVPLRRYPQKRSWMTL